MTLLFDLFRSREHCSCSRRTSANSQRRLRFESLEDRQLLSANPLTDTDSVLHGIIGSAEAPADGDSFIVTKDQSQTLYGVNYAIAPTDTGSLTLTVGTDDAISVVKSATGTVTKLSVSGTYSGTGTGYITDQTTVTTDITAQLPYYFKTANSTININSGANISQSCAGITGTAITVNVNDGGTVAFRSIETSEAGKYYNAATTITVNAGGTATGYAGFGNKATVLKGTGGTVTWTGNDTASSVGYVKTFTVSGGNTTFADGTYTLGTVTGGSVILNGTAQVPSLTVNTGASVTLNDTAKIAGATTGNAGSTIVMNGDSSITGVVKAYGSMTLSGNALLTSTLTTYAGSDIELKGSARVTGAVSTSGLLTLNDTSSIGGTLTVGAGTTTITGAVTLATVTVTGGTVLFPNSFPLTEGVGTITYNVGANQALLDTQNNLLYFNKTAKMVTTKTPASSSLTSCAISRMGTDQAWYAVFPDEGTASVDTNTWTFSDGTAEGTGTTYRFYGENTTPLTLASGATAKVIGAEISPHEANPAVFTYTYSNSSINVTSESADLAALTTSASIYLDARTTAYVTSVATSLTLTLYPDLQTIEEQEYVSKISWDGLLVTTASPRLATNSVLIYNKSNVVTMTLRAGMANSTIQSAGNGTTSNTKIDSSAANVTLSTTVPGVTISAGSFIIASNGRVATDAGTGTVSVASKTTLTLEGNGHADTVTTVANSTTNAAGNIVMKDTSSIDTLTLQTGLVLVLEQGAAVSNLTLKTGGTSGAIAKVYQTNDFTSTSPVYIVKATTNEVAGSVAGNGSSSMTLPLSGNVVKVNGMDYIATKDNAVVSISATGQVTGDVVLPDIAANLTITSLGDTIDATDGVVTLREAIAFSLNNIGWLAVTADNIAAGTHGLDPVTLQVVTKENMTAGKTYYRTGYYNGTAESISQAVIRFDASLAVGNDSPVVTIGSELLINTNGLFMDGTVGTKTITIDRGLYTGDNTILNDPANFYTYCNTPASLKAQIWKRVTGKETAYGRIFNITANVPVVLSNMTLTGAAGNRTVSGAVLYNRGALIMVNVTITGNVQEAGNDYGLIYSTGSPAGSAGTINMIGGAVEGNLVNGWGLFYFNGVKSESGQVLFDGVTVKHNSATNGSFFEMMYSTVPVTISNCNIVENVGNPIHVETSSSDYTVTDTSFIDNYVGGRNYIMNGNSTYSNCVFDNTGYDFDTLSDIRTYVVKEGTDDGSTVLVYNNCLFREVGIMFGGYSTGGNMDITLNYCTITDCTSVGTKAVYIYDDPNNSLDLKLNNTLVLGNATDLTNSKIPTSPTSYVNITATNSMIGYYTSDGGDVTLINNNSVIGTDKYSAVITMVSKERGEDGYCEVETIWVNERQYVLRGTSSSDSNEEVSIIGYNGATASDLSMTQVTAAWKQWNQQPAKGIFNTTVTTLEDVVDPSDGLIS